MFHRNFAPIKPETYLHTPITAISHRQVYNHSYTHRDFEVSPVIIGIVIVIITALLAFGGWKRISGFCELCVPVMTIIYIAAGILF